jgi:hypothetical protein
MTKKNPYIYLYRTHNTILYRNKQKNEFGNSWELGLKWTCHLPNDADSCHDAHTLLEKHAYASSKFIL